MSVAETVVPIPVEYLPTGDHALLMAWSSLPPIILASAGGWTAQQVDHFGGWLRDHTKPRALLCLEDGSAVVAELDQFKFDYRWHEGKQSFVDVSGIEIGEEEVVEGADTDQEPADDGGEGVPGLVPEAD